ncbi:glycosyltransferase [Marinobacter sp. CHS3-4]|uniref:glycosyltransferase family A protein n=1 Tax=Marinobacter sp. CHS3-4 TaxID=3045174 RepID=UPI0024B5CDFE|nr:glycosyltransferase [Marinobacter sp. CHS3-4]MDI9246697.1 glycosyltransferase [Marinobacter sp. CHS3-4]
MTEPGITFCVFSYNRGNFLKNCVDSIRLCVPSAEIIIFDDDSTDSDTQEYLSQIKSSVRVVGQEKAGEIKHGGLYHNMNCALRMCSDRSLVCFLQDDTQVVRPVSDEDFSVIDSLFARDSSLGFIHPCFIRGISLKKRPLTPLNGRDESVFFRKDTGQSAGIHYSDLVVFKPSRLLHAGWKFEQSEPENDRQARRLFGMMAYMWLPFAMWLPEVPAYRGKHKTLGLRLAERKKQVGFFPFKVWSQDTVQEARRNAGETLPVAEEWLECIPKDPPKPWTYNPLTGLGLFKQLNNLEIAIRRWINLNGRR